MKIKNYIITGNEILIYGKGISIKPEKLYTLFDNHELLRIKKDLKNKTIDNYLLNSWDVIYYIKLKNENVLTFSSSQYDNVYKLILI